MKANFVHTPCPWLNVANDPSIFCYQLTVFMFSDMQAFFQIHFHMNIVDSARDFEICIT